MKVISVISIVLLTTCAVSGNPLGPVKDSSDLDDKLVRQNRESPGNYEPKGCYSFGKLKKLKIVSKKAFKKTKASGNPLVQCFSEAKENNYEVIGIQKIKNNIICRKGNVKEEQWKADGVMVKGKLTDQKKCNGGVGSKTTISIYSKSLNPGINQQCTIGNKLFNEGDEAEMYHKTDNELNAYCQACECRQGEFHDCSILWYCEVGQLIQNCPFGLSYPSDECCPVCKRSQISCNGKEAEWVERQAGDHCVNCKCDKGGDEAYCEKRYCAPVSCKNPVLGKGACCPHCPERRATTTQQSFTILLTTERARPTGFPNFPFDTNEDQEH